MVAIKPNFLCGAGAYAWALLFLSGLHHLPAPQAPQTRPCGGGPQPSRPAPAASRAAAPASAGFNWQLYRFYNPGLSFAAEQQAEAHWERRGRPVGRCAADVPITFRYPGRAGLANQLYSHLTALTFAMHAARSGFSSVEVTVPPAVRRGGFAGQGRWAWGPAPIESLLDWERMRIHWAARGVRLSQADRTGAGCRLVHIPLLSRHGSAAEQGWASWREFRAVAGELAAKLAATACPAATTARAYNGVDAVGAPPCVLVDLETALFLINASSALPTITEAAQGLFFPQRLERAARAIVRQLAGLPGAGRGFQGVHLRIEEDWVAAGREGDLESYMEAMRAANFSRGSACYVASGIFSYWTQEEVQALERRLVGSGLCQSLQHRGRLLPAAALAGLHSEQLALIDLLVLSQARAVVGSVFSTFSWYVRELRALHGHSRDSFFVLDSAHPFAVPRKRGGLVFAP